jgi:energy-converting hydrogenase B subunit D
VIGLQLVSFALVATAGTAVVLTRDPLRQAVVNGFFGLTLIVFFFVLQAPDVAISAIVVETVAFPLILLAAISKQRRREEDHR